jgi:hypothetical protein
MNIGSSQARQEQRAHPALQSRLQARCVKALASLPDACTQGRGLIEPEGVSAQAGPARPGRGATARGARPGRTEANLPPVTNPRQQQDLLQRLERSDWPSVLSLPRTREDRIDRRSWQPARSPPHLRQTVGGREEQEASEREGVRPASTLNKK